LGANPDRSILAAKDPIKPVASGAVRKVFLDWWKDYLEGMMSFEMLDGWITSPFHWPLKEDEVRAQTRTQITALTDGAKKKLIQRLKDKAKKLRDKAKDLRKAGQDQKAQMARRPGAGDGYCGKRGGEFHVIGQAVTTTRSDPIKAALSARLRYAALKK